MNWCVHMSALFFLASLSLVKNDVQAEAVAQEAILKAFKNLSRFSHEG